MSQQDSEMQVDCTICVETVSEDDAVEVEGSLVCKTCIQNMFEPAFCHEHCYPPRCSSKKLEIGEFEHILGKEFATRYRKREGEYGTEIANRSYCACGEFVSGRLHRQNSKTKLPCHCSQLVCTACKTIVSTASTHECTIAEELAAQLEPGGLQRGVDFNTCQCGRFVERIDGCSHMTRVCGRGFCT